LSVSFYIDENVGNAITHGLRLRGVDVLSTLEDGRNGSPDPEILDRATELGRCLFSEDRDLLAEARKRAQLGIHFAGVVYVHQQKITIGDCIRGLELIAFCCEPADLANRVEYI
jgi:hypothetical protein